MHNKDSRIVLSDNIGCRACVPGTLASPLRLRLLRSSGMLEGHPRLDRLTQLASNVLDVPVVTVSLVDIDRQVFASHVGLAKDVAEAGQTPLSHSFCQYVVTRGEPLIIEDARLDEVLRTNRAVDELKVIAYAGFPIICREEVMGSFCAIRPVPHRWTPLELELLSQFAEAVSDQVEVRVDNEELKLASENLQGANEELERMSEILAHDLSTPLRGIRSSLYMFHALVAEVPEQGKELLEDADKSASRMSELIDALSRFGNSLHSDAAMETVDLDEIVEAVKKDLKDEIAGSGAVVEREGELGATIAVKALLRQLFQNLISNAMKFQPDGRSSVVKVGRRMSDGALYVKDNGIGIEEKALGRIFEIYRKGHDGKKYSGMGLGLATCSRIVSRHNGRIWVESEPGVGSTFFFILRGRLYDQEGT